MEQDTFRYNIGDTVYYADIVDETVVMVAGVIVDRFIVYDKSLSNMLPDIPKRCSPHYMLLGISDPFRESDLGATAERVVEDFKPIWKETK